MLQPHIVAIAAAVLVALVAGMLAAVAGFGGAVLMLPVLIVSGIQLLLSS